MMALSSSERKELYEMWDNLASYFREVTKEGCKEIMGKRYEEFKQINASIDDLIHHSLFIRDCYKEKNDGKV